MPAAGPRVAVIVPTPDAGRTLTRSCLAAVRRTTAHLEVRVEPIVSSGAGFRFARSINRGLRSTPDADAWVLLNDDCAMQEGWLDRMLDVAARHPDVGLVGAVLRYPSGAVQHAGGFIRTRAERAWHAASRGAPLWALRQWAAGRPPTSDLCAHYGTVDPVHRLDYLTAACLLVTRACREAVGEFDEEYEFGHEDADYALRALEAGFELALATQATGVHLERASGGGLRDAAQRSAAVFDRKWPQERIVPITRHGGRRGLHV